MDPPSSSFSSSSSPWHAPTKFLPPSDSETIDATFPPLDEDLWDVSNVPMRNRGAYMTNAPFDPRQGAGGNNNKNEIVVEHFGRLLRGQPVEEWMNDAQENEKKLMMLPNQKFQEPDRMRGRKGNEVRNSKNQKMRNVHDLQVLVVDDADQKNKTKEKKLINH